MYELYEVIQLTGAANETRLVDPLCRRFGLDKSHFCVYLLISDS